MQNLPAFNMVYIHSGLKYEKSANFKQASSCLISLKKKFVYVTIGALTQGT